MRRLVMVVTLLALGGAGAPRQAAGQQDVRVEAPISGGAAGEQQPLRTREARIARAVNLRAALLVVEDEVRRGLITAEQGARARALYLDDARASLGASFASAEDLDAYARAQGGAARRTAGLATFTGAVLTLAAIVTVVALGWLFRSYFRRLPLWAYELAAHAAAAGLVLGGHPLGRAIGIDGGYVALMGCLVFGGALGLTYATRIFPRLTKGGKEHLERILLAKSPCGLLLTPVNFISGGCTLVWGAAALWYQSTPVAAGATLAFISLVGFTVFVTPLTYYFGYTDEEKIPITMLAALALLGVYLGVQGGALALGPAAVFTRPFAWVGSLVYFVSLLIVASRYRVGRGRKPAKRPWARFWEWQAIAALSFVAGLYLGPTLGAPVLSGVAGTVFAFYLMEKYLEIPWRGRGWAWGTLGAGALLYAIGRAATAWPQYFLW
ncbi:MAG TPA: hypothetical protein VKA84_11875 [Gemmatimonadaceae bacterium]|nr:hypothetical protein [Gemmatimonadaceae bacterium]